MKKILLSLFFIGIITLPAPVAAANNVDLFKDICSQAPNNAAACQDNSTKGNPVYGPNGIITKIANIISIIVGIAAVISIMLAGARFITSGSNPEEVTKAREYVQYALIGLVLAASAQLIIRLVLQKIQV